MEESIRPPQHPAIWLSVVIPGHDEGDLLHDSVHSVLAAIEKSSTTEAAYTEVLVVLDNPSTATSSAAHSLAHISENIIVLENTRTPGPGGARNTAIYAAHGTWIGFLDGDDMWRIGAPDALVSCIRQYPDAQWIGGDFVNIDEAGNQISSTGELESRPRTSKVIEPAYRTGEILKCETPVAQFLDVVTCWTGATFVRKDALLAVGAFDERLRRGQDTHLWYRLALHYNFYFIPKVLAEYRQRPSTVNRRGYSPGRADRQSLRDLIGQEQFKPFRQLLVRRYCRSAIADCFFYRSERQWAKGLHVVAEALRISPFNARLWRQACALALRRAG